MKFLVTAGNSIAPIDRVRCIANIFTGRTGAAIAAQAARQGHDVCLLTSHPDVLGDFLPPAGRDRLRIRSYQTFKELGGAMADEIGNVEPDAVVHAAAVNDFEVVGAYVPEHATAFDPATGTWSSESGAPRLRPIVGGKLKSSASELWLRLVPTPKLVDAIRGAWQFRGILVKFKLEVGIEQAALEAIAAQARRQSGADFIVANTLEGRHEWAIIGDAQDRFERIDRARLAATIIERVELARKKS